MHNRNKYFHFHRDHGHNTDECYDLKQQIENLIRQGKLRNFLGREHKNEKLKGKVEKSSRSPLGEIRVIIGGSSAGQSSKSRKTYLKVVQNVQLSGRSPRMRTTDEQAITFMDEDAERVHHPHDDALLLLCVVGLLWLKWAGLPPAVLGPSILSKGVETGPTATQFDSVCAQTMPRLPGACLWRVELFQMSCGRQI